MIFPDENLSPIQSFLFVYGLAALLLVGFFYLVLKAMRFARQAREARMACDPSSVLTEGSRIIAGVVQYAEGEDRAVRVEVQQEGTETESSGSYSHRWVEKERQVLVSPFYIQHASGVRVRVEPTDEVFLVDDMDGVIFYDRTSRDRYAELTEGESVFAEGQLLRDRDPEADGGGYRSGRVGWVMRPPQGGRISLSSHPLEMRFTRWARFYQLFAVIAFLMLLTSQLATMSYHRLLWQGEVSEATLQSKLHFATVGAEGSTNHHYQVTSTLPWGGVHVDQIDEAGWYALPTPSELEAPSSPGESVPIRHVGQEIIQYGAEATVSGWLEFSQAVGMLTMVIFFWVYKRRRKAWFEGKMVDSAHGHLNRETGLKDPM